MKKPNGILIAIFLLTVSIFANDQASDKDAVRVPLENF